MAKSRKTTGKAGRAPGKKRAKSAKAVAANVAVKAPKTKSRLQQLDIANLPTSEDDRTEYKSSKTTLEALKEKLARAASGFWNTGGGLFVAGVDEQGKPDGGLPLAVGRTPVRDWIDQVVNQVSPVGSYVTRLFRHDPSSRLNIGTNMCAIAVEFDDSSRPPHMAPDHKYYIRAGAHTVPATHFIVEALWARRRLQRPQLAHSMRMKPEASDIIQLAIVALNEEPALSVTISLDPLPEMWKDTKAVFPLRLPVVDRTTPFYLDVTTYFAADTRLGPSVQLSVEYDDFAGNHYDYAATLDIKSIAPWTMGTPASERSAKALESIEKSLDKVPKALRDLREENSHLRARLEALQHVAFPQAKGDPTGLAAHLDSDAHKLLLAAKGHGTIFFGMGRLHAGQTQFISTRDDRREEAKWESTVLALRNMGLIDGVFERGPTSMFYLTDFGYRVADVLAEAPKDAAKETD